MTRHNSQKKHMSIPTIIVSGCLLGAATITVGLAGCHYISAGPIPIVYRLLTVTAILSTAALFIMYTGKEK